MKTFKDYYSENHEAMLERRRKYHSEHAEEENAKRRAYYQANKETQSAKAKARYYKDRAGNIERSKEWKRKNPTVAFNTHLKSKYGITIEDRKRLLQMQGGVCAVCEDPTFGGKEPCVDHDHKTGKVRGMICRKCNAGLGFLKDDITVVERLLEYLRKYQEKGA